MTGSSTPTVVLVHGGFVDGAGWEGVYNVLKKDGFKVSIVQNPTTSLADDVAATTLRDRARRYERAAERVPVPRQGEIPCLVRGRRQRGEGRVHG